MKNKLSDRQYTTPIEKQSKHYLTVTHPHHPYYGHKLEVLGYRGGSDPLIYVRLPDGTKASLEPGWVSEGPDGDRPKIPASHLLALDGLRAAAGLIEQMRRDGRVAKGVGKGRGRRA